MGTGIADLITQLEVDAGDLLAETRGGGGLTAHRAQAYTHGSRLSVFLEEILEFSPWSAQREIVVAVDGPDPVNRLCVYGANSVGKDALLARLALWWVYARDGLVLITAPTLRQLQQIIVRQELLPAFTRANLRGPVLDGQLHTMQLKRPDHPESGIVCFTSKDISRLSGYHHRDLLIVLSEAQGLEPLAWDAAQSCATDPSNVVIASGNPLYSGDRFEAASLRWTAIRISALDHPNVTGEGPYIPGGPSREWVEEVAADHGRDSDFFHSHVEGRFPAGGADTAVFERRWIEAAIARRRRGRPRGRWVFSCDPARLGGDASVLCVIHRVPGLTYVERFLTWSKLDTMETTGRIRRALRAYQCGAAADLRTALPGDLRTGGYDLIVDEPGIGAGVLDRLTEQRFPAVGFNGGAKPDDPTRYANRRAECYWRLRRALERGEVALPDEPKLVEELLAVRFEVTSEGKLKIEPKKNIRVRLGRSPDYADALVNSFVTENQCSGIVTMVDL